MNPDGEHLPDERVLLLAPTPKDAAMTRQVLSGAGVSCRPCTTLDELCREVAAGAGAVVLTDHALGLPGIDLFADLLRRQPPWSDLPVLILAAGGANSGAGRAASERLGNVTVLERPVQMSSLASVVRTLIRSRRRQYQIREHLRERGRAEAAMAELAEGRARLLDAERNARAEAERASRLKDEFLATLSHELRTPLNAILGWSQILSRPGTVRDEEDLAEGLRTIERNARAQTQIIDDLLDMSRIINGKVRLDVQPVELPPVIESALETVRPAADAKEIRIQTVLDPLAGTISADPNRLQQVFWNLLSNAIKFTPRGGHIRVVLGRAESHLEVCVIDTGQGIKPEFLPHAFDRFRQADASTTRSHGGLGLGLSIVKQLVELHGGTVRATSQGPGQGSTFTVTLPLTAPHAGDDGHEPMRPHPAAPAPAATSPAECVALDGLKVLVVDDEPDACALVKRVLEDCRATVITASSAADALSLLTKERPAVLVSDIGMPVEDGYVLIRRVRALGRDGGGNIPAVALTAYARSDDRAKSLQSGFQVHVTKPVDPSELLAVVASLARRAGATGTG